MKIGVIGGTGLDRLEGRRHSAPGGHEVVAASPNTDVNSITGEGLKEEPACGAKAERAGGS